MTKEEAVALLGFLLQQSADGNIVMVDGEFYWEEDKDGDQPISEEKMYDLFIQSTEHK